MVSQAIDRPSLFCGPCRFPYVGATKGCSFDVVNTLEKCQPQGGKREWEDSGLDTCSVTVLLVSERGVPFPVGVTKFGWPGFQQFARPTNKKGLPYFQMPAFSLLR